VWQFEVAPVEPFASIEEIDPGEPAAYGEAVFGDSDNEPLLRTPVRPRRANLVTVLLAVSAMIALGGVSFAVGRMASTGGSTIQSTVGGANGQPAGGNGLPGVVPNASGAPLGPGGGLPGGGLPGGGTSAALAAGSRTVSGTVVSVSSNSITVRQANGQTITIATGSSTTYHSQTPATAADVTAGATVVVQTAGRSGFGRERGGVSAGASPGTSFGRTASSVTIVSQ
jgi:hypothetical protein